MMATIDAPVNVFSSVDAVRDWIVTLEDLRERYRDDHEALRRIAGEELHANRLASHGSFAGMPRRPGTKSAGASRLARAARRSTA